MGRQGKPFQPQWLSERPSIVQPVAFAKEIEARDAVLCCSERIFSHLLEAFDLCAGRGAPRLPGALDGKLDDDVAVYLACFGAPAAGSLMEALIASGVERVVMVGQAGAISPRCRIGDLFLPTWGVREEGTSYHYLSPDVTCEVSAKLLDAIRGCLSGVQVVEGGVWTTDALFRESADKVEAFAAKGVLAVEMECTALMAIAMVRRVAFAAAMVVTDELFSGAWVEGFRRQEVARSQDLLCRRLAEAFRERGRFA